MKEQKSLLARCAAARFSLGVRNSRETLKDEPQPHRPCIVCGRMKQHNNSFCSADCCRTYRANDH